MKNLNLNSKKNTLHHEVLFRIECKIEKKSSKFKKMRFLTIFCLKLKIEQSIKYMGQFLLINRVYLPQIPLESFLKFLFSYFMKKYREVKFSKNRDFWRFSQKIAKKCQNPLFWPILHFFDKKLNFSISSYLQVLVQILAQKNLFGPNFCLKFHFK